MSKKTLILIIVAIILVIGLAIGGYFYWKSSRNIMTDDQQKALNDAIGAAESLADSINQGILPDLNSNPLENEPDVNPASANPLKDVKVNPFE